MSDFHSDPRIQPSRETTGEPQLSGLNSASSARAWAQYQAFSGQLDGATSAGEIAAVVTEISQWYRSRPGLPKEDQIEHLEEFALQISERSTDLWRSSVSLLQISRDLRIELEGETGRFDTEALRWQMMILSWFEQFNSGIEDVKAYSAELLKTVQLVDSCVRANPGNEAELYRCLSIGFWLSNEIPFAFPFDGGTEEISAIVRTMAGWASGTNEPAASVRQVSDAIESYSGFSAAFLNAALANYHASIIAEPDRAAHLEIARSFAIVSFNQLSAHFEEIAEDPKALGKDSVGTPVPLKRLIAYDALSVRLRLSGIELQASDTESFLRSWRSLTDCASGFSDLEFERIVAAFNLFEIKIENSGKASLAAALNLEMAHCCYNRFDADPTQVIGYYNRAIQLAKNADEPHLQERIILDGLRIVRLMSNSLDTAGFNTVGQFYLHAYSAFVDISTAKRQDADDKPISDAFGAVYNDGPEGETRSHPLIANPSTLLIELLRLVDRYDRVHRSSLRLTTYILFAEYNYNQERPEQGSTYTKLAQAFLNGFEEKPPFTNLYLARMYLRLGKLLEEDPQNQPIVAFDLFEEALKLSDSSLEPEKRAELLFRTSLHHSEMESYGTAMNRLRVANGLLNPQENPDQRELAFSIWELWRKLEAEHGDESQAQKLEQLCDQARLDWDVG